MKRPRQIFVLLTVVLVVIFFLADWLNERFWLNDFKVFYGATTAWLNGEEVYGPSFGLSSGRFKYTPITLLFFVPFTWLNYTSASIVFYVLSAKSAIVALLGLERLWAKYSQKWSKHTFLLLVLCLVAIGNHLFRELHLGNVNMLIVCALVLALHFTEGRMRWLAAFFLALVIFTKPYLVLLIVPLLASQKWGLLTRLALIGVAMLLLSAMVFGIEGSITLHEQWVSSVVGHNNNMESSNTVFSILDALLGWNGNHIANLVYGSVSLLLGGLFIIKQKIQVKSLKSHKFIVLFFIVLALAPSLLITDTEHFLFSLPLLMLTLNDTLTKGGWGRTILFTVIVLLYGFVIDDLLPKDLYNCLNDVGALGIANLFLIAWSIKLLFNDSKAS